MNKLLKYSGISLLIVLMSLFSFSSCKKDSDKWKQPVDINFLVGLASPEKGNGNGGNGGNGNGNGGNGGQAQAPQLQFNQGSITLTSFKFEGKRLEGDNISFERNYEEGLELQCNENLQPAELDFEVPQGTYENMTVELVVERQNTNGISIKGIYTNPFGEEFEIDYKHNQKEVYSITVKKENGGEEMFLSSDTPSSFLINFDPYHWFNPVSNAMFNNADKKQSGGKKVIPINKSSNKNLHKLLQKRVGKGTKAIKK